MSSKNPSKCAPIVDDWVGLYMSMHRGGEGLSQGRPVYMPHIKAYGEIYISFVSHSLFFPKNKIKIGDVIKRKIIKWKVR